MENITLPKLELPKLVTSLQTQNQREGYIPKDQRKKILLLSDDLRMPSGVGVMSREIVLQTAHRFNWVQLGAGINHPEAGRALDASQSVSQDTGVPDASLKIYPYNGYGDANIIRTLMMVERPNAILHFTDPRYWVWLYHLEAEIRENIPILFYHIWDDLPYPKYNENYYRSCDWISCISKQTYNIVQNVWEKEPKWEPWQIKYIPHGVDPNIFKKLEGPEGLEKIANTRKQMFGDDADKVKFVVLFNNRNIRRKMPGDVVLAFREFIRGLPEEERDSCRLVLHTQPIDDNGTDLPRVLKDVAPDVKFIFSSAKVAPPELNAIINNCDVVINMASNEGFGLATLEGIMAEKMIVANVTGGLQDQMGFVDENGEYLRVDKHFCAEWGSNHDGKYQEHGEWVVPVFPSNRAMVGSPPTPYIFDDRCKFEDAAVALRQIYDMSPEERARRGKLGREYALSEGYHNKAMGQGFIDGIEEAFANWKPRERFNIFKV
jgi:hypothetical protein